MTPRFVASPIRFVAPILVLQCRDAWTEPGLRYAQGGIWARENFFALPFEIVDKP